MSHHIARPRWSTVLVGFALMLGAVTVVGARAAEPVPTHPARTATAHERRRDPPIRQLPPPRRFVKTVDNRYLPWIPGTRWFYVGGADGEERITVKVLHRTRQIEGITATVVRDTVRVDGERIEDTFDWYAQDRHGNVWYLGEDTKEYEDGIVVSTEGSWEAGVDNASAGIAMLAHPCEGDSYLQEFREGHAEDQGKVLERGTRAVVPFGQFRHVRMTLDTTTLDPNVSELKFYAPGVGTIRELDLSPDQASTDLIRMVKP